MDEKDFKALVAKRGKSFSRSLSFSREHIDIDNRTIEVSFSSNVKVLQPFGYEILDHSKMDLEFLSSGRAPVLKDHDVKIQLGVVVNAWIDNSVPSDPRGRAVLRYGKSEEAEEEFRDIIDGIRTNISCSYDFIELVSREEGKGGEPSTFTLAVKPYEISTVSVPADQTVGVGRSKSEIFNKDSEMTATEKKEPDAQEASRAAPNVTTSPVFDKEGEIRSAREKEVNRMREIQALCARHDLKDMEEKAIQSGVSVAQFKGEILERVATKPARLPEGEIDMSNKERESYSLMRALNAAGKKDWSKAGLELECSKELEKQYGRAARGFFVPTNINWGYGGGQRDLTVASTNGGSKLKGVNQRGDLFIDALREEILFTRLGARVLTGLQGDIDIPSLSGATTVAFMTSETSAVTEGAPTFSQKQLAPKTCSGWVDISRKLRYQSDPSVEQIVRGDIISQIANKIEDVSFEGGGSGEPSGLINCTNINVVSLGTNGAAPTFASTVDMIKQVAIDKGLRGALAYVGSPQAWYKLATTAKVASTDSQMILNVDMNVLNGYPFYMSTNVPSDLTKGAGSSLSALFYGNFNDFFLAFWSGVDIVVDEASLSTIGGLRIAFFQDVDVTCRHDESFAVIKDMVTT